MDNSALFVFECLLRDNAFMSCIDDYIMNIIFATKTFDAKNVPQLVLILVNLFSRSKNFIDVEKSLKNDSELNQLLEIFHTYIIDRIKENPNLNEFDVNEFKKSYDICARLAIFKLKFSKKTSLFCVGKSADTQNKGNSSLD
jgi:hypothetical protein